MSDSFQELRQLKVNPADLSMEYSPSIPEKFPKSRIPKELCDKQLLKLMRCTKVFTDRDQCHHYYEEFKYCKKVRDLTLFDQIKDWESTEFQKYPKQQQSLYIQGLTLKKQRLMDELDKLPSSFSYNSKSQLHQSDIDQLQWRISYLQQK